MVAAGVSAMMREGVDESIIWRKGLFVTVVGENTVGVWV